LTTVECVAWTERLLGFALLLQTLELLQLRRTFSDSGVWAFAVLAEELQVLPRPLRWLLPYPAFMGVLALRLALAPLLMLGVSGLAPLLLLSQLLICARFRGTFNGGSDYMSVVVLLGLTGAACFPGSPSIVKASLAYICVQLVFSYFIAGSVKLARTEWRSGVALARLLASNRYGTPAWLVRLSQQPALAKVLTWALLAFECGFPAALLGPRVAALFLACGTLFHLGNVVAFGLNRFLFAWLAAYPALLYFSAELARS
jgi:hypothetical protein